ncbi:unnamed protein product [Clonostachys rhizophaga]|uniref:T6SS Phospholipase effector Tle1-like catalytic domain-containing protein n=1 Tax=Clonostachys rhizophaga TaxID=160324 RepID=A0A9N9VFV8_9HYPO|nr:unnamed protein product [Clonostachys rhizophaga]
MAQEPLKLASYKRIIVCADGTWLSSDQGSNSVPSNVAKIARAISKTGLDEKGNLVKQVVFYQSGLGSGDLPVQKAIYGAIGLGLDTDIIQLYDFISNNYEIGDELFFFGFSRGAFTVRSAAGIVSDVGVFSPVNMSRFPEMLGRPYCGYSDRVWISSTLILLRQTGRQNECIPIKDLELNWTRCHSRQN